MFNIFRYVKVHKNPENCCRPGPKMDYEICSMEKYKNGRNYYKEKTVPNIFNFKIYLAVVFLLGAAVNPGRAMHAVNGNRFSPYLDVMQQNFPGRINSEDLYNDIENILRRYKPDVLILSEVSSETVSKLTFSSYTFYPGSINGNKIRVSALVKCQHQVVTESLKAEVPTVCLKISDWQVVGVYREWSKEGDTSTNGVQDQELRFLDLLTKLRKFKGKRLICGDFNFCHISNSDHQLKLARLKKMTAKFMNPRGMVQLVQNWTRHQRGQKSSCLDHLYITNEDLVTRKFNKNVTGYDHNLIGCRISIKKPLFKPKVIYKRDYDSINYEEFESLFERSNLHELYAETDVDTCLEILEHKIMFCLEKLAPIKKIITRPKFAPWVNDEILHEMKIRDNYRQAAVDLKTNNYAWTCFKQQRNKVKNMTRTAKKKYLEDQLSVQDSKTAWARVQRLSGTSKKTDSGKIVLETEKGILENDDEVANYLNEFFKMKVVKLQQQTKPDVEKSAEYAREYLGGRKINNFSFHTVPTREIKRVIRGLTNTNSVGRDLIPVEILKRYRHFLAPPIRHLCNQAIMQCKFPRGWKYAIIKPLPKKGNKRIPKNWRPVCLLPNLSKILEGVLNDQLKQHLETNEIMSKIQHGYRKHRSTISAWTELDTVVSAARDSGLTAALL